MQRISVAPSFALRSQQMYARPMRRLKQQGGGCSAQQSAWSGRASKLMIPTDG